MPIRPAFAVLFALCLGVVPAAPAAAQPATVAFRLGPLNQIHVPVTINGVEGIAVLDNAAAVTVIDDDFARKHDLEQPGFFRALAGLFRSNPQNLRYGSDVTVGLGPVQMRLSPAIVDLAPLAKADGKDVLAIVGAEFFMRNVVEVDFDASRLEIHDREAFTPGPGWVSVPVTRRFSKLSVPVRIEGNHVVDSIIDLGSFSVLTVRQNEMTRAWAKADRPYVTGEAQMILNGELQSLGRRFMATNSLEFAGHAFANAPVVVEDNDSTLPVTAMLGMGLLRSFNLVFDIGGSRLWVKPNKAYPPDYSAWRVRGHAVPGAAQ